METTLVKLPDEVNELAQKVPIEKQQEVQTVLSQIFAGTADWERQVDSIEVKDIHDTMSIQLADVARKNAKQARIHAEKIFDAKREEVQSRMQNDKLEDSLWLKSKQIMQLKFKSIEEKAEWKANFVRRYEAEQNEIKTQLRLSQVAKFSHEEINRYEIEHMSDNLFATFLTGLEKSYNDRIESERKAEEERLKIIQVEKERQEKIKLENEQLKKDAIERERLAEIERKKQADILAKQKDEADKREKELQDKANAERKERERLAEEIEARKQAELKLEKERIASEKKAKLAPDKTKLLNFMQVINDLPRPDVKSIEAAQIVANINTLLVKVADYIKENASKL